jgi:hypothetical protein
VGIGRVSMACVYSAIGIGCGSAAPLWSSILLAGIGLSVLLIARFRS